jgi:hypothetical protein
MIIMLFWTVLMVTMMVHAPSSIFVESFVVKVQSPIVGTGGSRSTTYSSDIINSNKSFPRSQNNNVGSTTTTTLYSMSPTNKSSKPTAFQLVIDVPPSNSDVQVTMNIDPILSVPSELIVVRYKVPFGLNIEPRKNFAIVTANGPGGEQIGDVLRYTSQWTLGLPRGDGIGTTFASFAGGLKWQCSMFNVMSVKQWEQVILALVSNTVDRTDEVVLIFERPLNGVIPPELQ